MAADLQLQGRPVVHRRRQGFNLRFGRRRERRPPRVEFDIAQFFTAGAATSAAEKRSDQGKGSGHGPGDNIEEKPEHDATDAELGIVEGSTNRKVDVNDAVSILEQGDGEQDGRFDRGRTLDSFAEDELVQNDLILGRQFSILHLVLDVERKLAALNSIADVLHGIGCETAELDFFGIGRDI